MPSPSKLAHIVLKTHDVQRLRAFYCTLLDANVTFEQLPQASFITYDDEHHRMAFALLPAPVDGPVWKGPGLAHVAFTFSDIRALLQQYDKLKLEGIEPAVAINHGPTVSLYYQDPDQNAVEMQIDRLSLKDGAVFMATPVFAANPIGIPLDLDALVQRMNDGATDEELLHYDASIPVDVPALGQRLMEVVNMI